MTGLKENIIRVYMNSWIQMEASSWDTIFANNIVYIESDGHMYVGLDQMKQWFERWIKVGQVTQWNVLKFVHEDQISIVKWYFQCIYEGVQDEFIGVSWITFDADGKIARVEEYAQREFDTPKPAITSSSDTVSDAVTEAEAASSEAQVDQMPETPDAMVAYIKQLLKEKKSLLKDQDGLPLVYRMQLRDDFVKIEQGIRRIEKGRYKDSDVDKLKRAVVAMCTDADHIMKDAE